MQRWFIKHWFFRISDAEIDMVARHLIEQHGLDGAREEALRLAEVGRRIGSKKNNAIFLRAAQRIALAQGIAPSASQLPRSRVERFSASVAEFGAPRAPVA